MQAKDPVYGIFPPRHLIAVFQKISQLKLQVMKKKLFRITAITTAILISFTSLANLLIKRNFFSAPFIGPDNEFLQTLRDENESYNKFFPEERVYLQFDKSFYSPGETVWFSGWIADGQSFLPSTQSEIMHVELVNPQGNVMSNLQLISKDGRCSGDFTIDEGMPGGLYKVRAFTNWMKNETDSVRFEKTIQVQRVILPRLKMKLDFEKKAFGAGDEVVAKLKLNTNANQPLSNFPFHYKAALRGDQFTEGASATSNNGEMFIRFKLPAKLKTADGLLNVMIDYEGQTESVSRSIPILLNTVKMQFFPEGGDLVEGIESTVAFEAKNEFGKAADVEGFVSGEDGKPIAQFASYHNGMGSFNLNPQDGKNYRVHITKPVGVEDVFEIPAAKADGYVLHADVSNENEVALNISSNKMENLNLVGQTRGKIYFTSVIKAVAGKNTIKIPASLFPEGVAQFTVFDSKGVQRCERLVFLNKKEGMKLSIETDKEKYLPREKVKLTLHVTDASGAPSAASLALAVANDQLLSFADDKQANILSTMLFGYDLTGKIEEPNFYFDATEAKADAALDLLMMTHGWRRYSWKKVMNGDLPLLSFLAEKTLISGKVMDGNTGQPLRNAQVKISPNGKWMLTGDDGAFAFRNIDLSAPGLLTVTAQQHQPYSASLTAYQSNMNITLYEPQVIDIQSLSKWGAVNQMGWEDAPAMAAPMGGIEARDFSMNEQIVLEADEEQMKLDDAPPAPPADELDKAKENGEEVEEIQADSIAVFIPAMDIKQISSNLIAANGALYYRAKEFSAPDYSRSEATAERSDFRSTIYWNGRVDVDETGIASLEFYNSDELSSFRISAEGIGGGGIIHGEKAYFTQQPFQMSVKLPLEVTAGDIVSIPLTLKNNSEGTILGNLKITAPSSLKEIDQMSTSCSIPSGNANVVYVKYEVLNDSGIRDFSVSFNSLFHTDAFTQHIKILPKGFPVTASFSGHEDGKTFGVDIKDLVPNSIFAEVIAYPNVVSDLMQGVESILREPSGCFEQTSMSSYPNVMALDYMKTSGNQDQNIMKNAEDLIDRGYKRLTTFETPNKGYEWFGATPAHEGLTAYGLMQFSDMKSVYGNVSQDMIDRTAKWLMSRKDGNGGFLRESHAYHSFGQISEDVMNAYIVYGLAEAGYTDIGKELNKSLDIAMKNGDPYQLALVAAAFSDLKDDARYKSVMMELMKKKNADGSWTGTTHSITYSTGQSLTIETTSLALLAMLKNPGSYFNEMQATAKFIVGQRSGYGEFGNTQGTILALKALTTYAKYNKHAPEGGTMEVYIDGVKAGEQAFKAGESKPIKVSGLEKYLSEGHHTVRIKYVGLKNPLPYSAAISWNTTVPNSQKECAVRLHEKLAAAEVKVGETLRLSATIENTSANGLPSTMAIIGIPAGLTLQPWQLKEMQEKGVVDFYEVKGNNLVCYLRGMDPNEKREINLDLKAEIPGTYAAPASCAYLYYTNEFKDWTSIEAITVK